MSAATHMMPVALTLLPAPAAALARSGCPITFGPLVAPTIASTIAAMYRKPLLGATPGSFYTSDGALSARYESSLKHRRSAAFTKVAVCAYD